MTTFPHKPPVAAKAGETSTETTDFFYRFVRLAGPFWSSERKGVIRGMTVALVVLTVLQVAMAVVVTEWSKGLFDALEQRSMSGLTTQVGLVVLILLGSMSITVAHLKIKRRIQLDWRGWLTEQLIGQWMFEGRHDQITHMPGKHDNPDGRIAEDIRIATEYAIDLCHSAFFCLLLLFSFIKILWRLSGTVNISLDGLVFELPGHLVWIALAYAVGASVLGWWIGLPLIRATDNRQTMEANFRFGLVRTRENSEAIALTQGEPNERQRLIELFRGIVAAWQRQTTALSKITLFTSGYSVLSMTFPVLVSAPRFILGSITLGALVQSAQAFQQLVGALSWPVDNLARLAEWRASVERVLGLEKALKDLEEDITQIDPNTILVEESDQPTLIFQGLCVANPDGAILLAHLSDEIKLGERVLMSGNPAAGGKIFKVIAGLWPWGRGRVALPKGEQLFFMPPRPFLPIGSLREAVTYPASAESFEEMAIANALKRVGLGQWIECLEVTSIWEKTMTREEQQRLGFARLLLHRPNWILIQEALDSLDSASEEAMISMVCQEFPSAAVVTLSYQPNMAAYHHRQLLLPPYTNGQRLIKETRLKREADRRGKIPTSWQKRLLGHLRKDRRKPQ